MSPAFDRSAMRSLRALFAALAAVLLALPRAADAQDAGVLALKVTDPQGAPLSGAAVKIDAVRRGTTGENGRAVVGGIAPGWHALKVTLIGRRPIAMGMMVPAGGVAELEVGMESAPVALPGISGTVAVTAATINVVGGFIITRRMLGMFKRSDRRPSDAPKV